MTPLANIDGLQAVKYHSKSTPNPDITTPGNTVPKTIGFRKLTETDSVTGARIKWRGITKAVSERKRPKMGG